MGSVDKAPLAKAATTLSHGPANRLPTPEDHNKKTCIIFCTEEGKQEWLPLHISNDDKFEDIRALCIKALNMQEKRPEDVEIRWRWDGRLLGATNCAETLGRMTDDDRIDRLLVVFCADEGGNEFDPWKPDFGMVVP